MEVWLISGLGALLLLVLSLLWGSREPLEDSKRLTQLWREYAMRRGDRVIESSRMELIVGNDTTRYAMMEGVRNSVPFRAAILVFDTHDEGKRQTYFDGEPIGWPNKSWLMVEPEANRHLPRLATVQPSLVTHQFVIYSEPRDLVSIFSSAAGDALLADLAKLPMGTSVSGTRNDFVEKWSPAGEGGPNLSIKVPEWCVDTQLLDACIDLVTRLCSLRPRSRFP
jgi:hypothetical protein